MLWTKCNAGCVFPHSRGQRWPVFVWSTHHISDVCHFVMSNRYIYTYLDFSEYYGIYRWNPCKSLDFFNIFLDFTSVYCEIHEILSIYILVSSSNLCIQVSGCWLQEKRGRDLYFFVFVFWSKLIHLLISFITLYIYLEFRFAYSMSVLSFNSQTCCMLIRISSIHYKSSIYLDKSSDFLNILRISSLNIVKSSDLLDLFFHSLYFCNIKGIFGFYNSQ